MSSKASTPPVEKAPTEGQAVPPARIPNAGEGVFHAGRVVWGRPPQVTFRAGPLPRDEGLARLMAMPPHPQPPKPKITGSTVTGAGAGGFSNVPQPQRQPTAPAGPANAPVQASKAGIFGNSLVPPPAAKPKPAAPVAPVAPKVEPAVEKPIELEPITVFAKAAPDASPAMPVSRPAAQRGPGLWIGVGAFVIAAGAAAIWWSSRSPEPAATVPVTSTEVSASEVVAPEAAAPIVEDTIVAQEPVASAPVAPATSAPAQARPVSEPNRAATTPARPQPTPTRAPVSQPLPEASTPPPVVVVAPTDVVTPPVVDGPPPTVARPAETDPNAPVVTRPAKLD